ncbi:MAG: hypothetical protein JSU67_03285, partial [Gammaproteobacteria bacterium]
VIGTIVCLISRMVQVYHSRIFQRNRNLLVIGHCEEHSDEAIFGKPGIWLEDCFASLAMTERT